MSATPAMHPQSKGRQDLHHPHPLPVVISVASGRYSMIAELNNASAIKGLGTTHGLIVSIVKSQNYVSL